jgi:hypothetical protein
MRFHLTVMKKVKKHIINEDMAAYCEHNDKGINK